MKTDIITFSEELINKTKTQSAPYVLDDLTATGKAYHIVYAAAKEMITFEHAYSFKSSEEEIKFFKEMKPVLMSLYFYYQKKFSILLFDSFHHDQETRMHNYNKAMRKIQRFASANEEFFRYCLSGETIHDKEYFTRNPSGAHLCEFDKCFAIAYDVRLSRLLSCELLKDFINQLISKTNKQQAFVSPLHWTDSKVAMIELIYAIHASGIIDNGKTDIKQIVKAFQQLFNIDLGNYARVFAEIRIRKNGQTTFIDRIRGNLLHRIEELND